MTSNCVYCDEPLLPHEERAPYQPHYHYECGVRCAVGSVAHQRGQCSCYGGSEEDPPEMTRREAAIAAAQHFHASTAS